MKHVTTMVMILWVSIQVPVSALRAQEEQVEESAAAIYDTLAGDLPGVVLAGKKPYLVVADVYVPPGKSVSIQAGTVFLFRNFTGLQVQGKLLVKGSPQAPVVFTSENDRQYNLHESPPPAPYDWNGVYIHADGIGTEITNGVVTYSVSGITSDTKFIRLNPCLLSNNGRANLTIEGEEHEVGDKPYEYAVSLKDAAAKGVPLAVLKDPLSIRRSIFRYSGVALCVGGAAMGIVYAANLKNSSRDFDKVSSKDATNLSQHTQEDWTKARSRRNKDGVGTALGWTFMAIGVVGFSWTFTF